MSNTGIFQAVVKLPVDRRTAYLNQACGDNAELQQPVRRQVALKIIKPGMDTRDVIARFEAERQALALMDHPNIARVLDAGTTRRAGRLYRDGAGPGYFDRRVLRSEATLREPLVRPSIGP